MAGSQKTTLGVPKDWDVLRALEQQTPIPFKKLLLQLTSFSKMACPCGTWCGTSVWFFTSWLLSFFYLSLLLNAMAHIRIQLTNNLLEHKVTCNEMVQHKNLPYSQDCCKSEIILSMLFIKFDLCSFSRILPVDGYAESIYVKSER